MLLQRPALDRCPLTAGTSRVRTNLQRTLHRIKLHAGGTGAACMKLETDCPTSLWGTALTRPCQALERMARGLHLQRTYCSRTDRDLLKGWQKIFSGLSVGIYFASERIAE
jgi:hypothetical protein